MLLPDNIHPESSIYYNGSIILNELENVSKLKIIDLYYNIKKDNEMSFSIFLLSLDWLYLIDVAKIDERGFVYKCI